MAKRSRPRWAVVLGSWLAIIGILIGGAVGYWEYANYVPPFRPQLPPMPSPNGYEQAAIALARLSQIRRPPLPKNWPEATPSELQAQLAAVRPILDQIDAALQLQWRAPPMLNESDFEAAQPALRYLRECARSYFAQSSLSGSRGDYATAMQNCLDAMELGAKSAHGSVLVNWFTAVACHAIGLRGAEQMALRVPADALPGMLARVRRIGKEWPRLAEMWANQRSFDLGSDTDLFRQLQRVPLSKKLDAIESLSPLYQSAGRWDTIKRALTPRVVVLSDTNKYYNGQIAQSDKPVRQRVPISPPADAWSDMVFPIDLSQGSWRLEGAQTGLALLEVALAVRMHYLEHGRYPARLAEVSRRWLPEVPRDLWDQPIAYHLKNGRPVIYSLGPDGKDDGGQPADPIDLTPATRGDLVFGHLSHHLHGR